MKRASGHRNGAGNRVTVYERVTERVTELLSQGVVPLAESPGTQRSDRLATGCPVVITAASMFSC